MKVPRWLIAIVAVLITPLLAFRLSGVVYVMLVLPASYLLWLLKLLYLAMPGELWWSALALAVALIFALSLVPDMIAVRGRKPLHRSPMGNVESLALWLDRSPSGVYYKWLVANRLGRIAFRLLEGRAAQNKRVISDGLSGPGWTPPAPVQAYLETGLLGSFADYPRNSKLFPKLPPTPLDHDVEAVAEFLESQQSDGRS